MTLSLQGETLDEAAVRDRVVHLIHKHAQLYQSVVVGTFLFRDPSGQDVWRHARTRIDIEVVEAASTFQPITWSYPTAIFAKFSLGLDQFTRLISELTSHHRLSFPDLPAIDFDATSGWYEYLASQEHVFNLGWPCHHFRLSPQRPVHIPGGPFLAIANPIFLDPYSLIREQLVIRFPPGAAAEGTLDLLLPDPRAKITRLTLGHNRLSADVRAERIPLGDAVLKIHVAGQSESTSLHRDFRFVENPLHIDVPISTGEILACLFSESAAELLDFRHFRLTEAGLQGAAPDVHLEAPREEEVRALLLGGENDHVEFKPALSDTEDIAETLVAFSNSTGGLVIIGADDRGAVTGFGAPNAENTVQNIIRGHCEPVVTVEVEPVTLDGKPLLVIRVPEGGDKPYALRQRGVIIRAGSTDRVATRYELDLLYEQRGRGSNLLQMFRS